MLVLLREALSNQNTPFVKLMRLGKGGLSDDLLPPLPQVNEVDPGRYRMNRKLTRAQRAKLAEEYRFGLSALELARKYQMHRHTVSAHLEREGVNGHVEVPAGGQIKVPTPCGDSQLG
jgi:hypothetical protein